MRLQQTKKLIQCVQDIIILQLLIVLSMNYLRGKVPKQTNRQILQEWQT